MIVHILIALFSWWKNIYIQDTECKSRSDNKNCLWLRFFVRLFLTRGLFGLMFYRPRVSLSAGSQVYGSASVVGPHSYIYIIGDATCEAHMTGLDITQAISWLIMSAASEKATSQTRCPGNPGKRYLPRKCKCRQHVTFGCINVYRICLHRANFFIFSVVIPQSWLSLLTFDQWDACQLLPHKRAWLPHITWPTSYLGFSFFSLTSFFLSFSLRVFCFSCQVQRLLVVVPQGKVERWLNSFGSGPSNLTSWLFPVVCRNTGEREKKKQNPIFEQIGKLSHTENAFHTFYINVFHR